VLDDDLFNYRRPHTADVSYAAAPRSLTVDPGEDLFRRRCQVCHTVGAGDTVGPDLVGVVAKRDRKWLARWIQAPNELLDAKDPLATALYAQYKQVNMPNLRLSDHDVEVRIGYLEAESGRVGDMKQAQAEHAAAHQNHEHHQH
jgi:protein SCO1/2